MPPPKVIKSLFEIEPFSSCDLRTGLFEIGKDPGR